MLDKIKSNRLTYLFQMFAMLLKVTSVAINHLIDQSYYCEHPHDQAPGIQIVMEMFDPISQLYYATNQFDVVLIVVWQNVLDHPCIKKNKKHIYLLVKFSLRTNTITLM